MSKKKKKQKKNRFDQAVEQAAPFLLPMITMHQKLAELKQAIQGTRPNIFPPGGIIEQKGTGSGKATALAAAMRQREGEDTFRIRKLYTLALAEKYEINQPTPPMPGYYSVLFFSGHEGVAWFNSATGRWYSNYTTNFQNGIVGWKRADMPNFHAAVNLKSLMESFNNNQ